jgi:hypothetical protein
MIKSRMIWAGHAHGEKRNAYGKLMVKPEGKRPLGRPINRWVNNIKIDLREEGGNVITGVIWLRTGNSRGLL